jgi:hypothetical protein
MILLNVDPPTRTLDLADHIKNVGWIATAVAPQHPVIPTEAVNRVHEDTSQKIKHIAWKISCFCGHEGPLGDSYII